MDRTYQLAWAAGFIDGEGFVGLSRGVSKKTGRPFHQLIVDVSQMKREPLDVLVELFGSRVRLGRQGTVYFWRVGTTDAVRVLREIAPYTVGKRRQVELGIEFGKTLCGRQGRVLTPELLAFRETAYAEFRVLNRRYSHAERLSEWAPQAAISMARHADDAIVRAGGK